MSPHGDFDHMGEATNLAENFKIENVIFNCGEYNELEQELIKVLAKKKTKYNHIEVEKKKDILGKYNLKNIDFLKVGHHGSNTSSSEYFINEINPKYSLISVGKNNRYGHPKDEVLETLKNSKIYRTDLDRSIEIRLNKNGYKIKTCPP